MSKPTKKTDDGEFSDQRDDDFLDQSDAANDKHLLIKVPDFGTGTFQRRGDRQRPSGYEETESLSSFMRLGKFDFADETPRSKELLATIHLAGGPGDPRRTNRIDFDPATDDWLTEAPPFAARPVGSDQKNSAGNNDVFFLDDVRTHDVDLDASILAKQDEYAVRGHGLTMAQRQKESQQLYARGGWRDHSDGNRLSTTYGDKVEVVRGNYKMIVLGRQDDPGEGMGWDVAGDHVVDYAPGTMPGAGYWLEFVPDYKFTTVGEPAGENRKQTGVWLLVNTTEGVYEYARYAGNFREERWGDVLETYTGSSNPPTAGKIATDHVQGTKGHDPPVRLDGCNYDLPKYGNASSSNPVGTKTDRLVPEWEHDNKDVIRSNPHIIEKTWATRIDSHTGSSDCPVTHGIFEKTFAKRIEGETGSADARIEEIVDTTYAKQVNELTDVSVSIMSNTRAGSILEATTAGAILSSTTAATIQELTTSGLHTSIEVGAAIDVFLGAKLEIQVAGAITISTSTLELDITKKGIHLNKDEAILDAKLLALSSKDVALQNQVTALNKSVNALKVDNKALMWDVVGLTVKLGM